MQQHHVVQSPLNLLPHQMQAPTAGDAQISLELLPKSGKTREVESTFIQRTIPPTTTFDIEARQLLLTWAQTLMEYLQDAQAGAVFKPKIIEYSPDTKAIEIDSMRYIVGKATNTFKQLEDAESRAKVSADQLEMVALIPDDCDTSFKSGAEATVRALALFRRGQLNDDDSGSIKRAMYAKAKRTRTRTFWQTASMQEIEDRTWWDRAVEEEYHQFDVFFIEGLVDAPGLDEESTKDLMSQIEKYAHKDKRIVVVSERAYIVDGVDVSSYYVRHGFRKVEMEDREHPVLIYTQRWSDSKDVVDPQVMVGVNLWTGI